MSSPDRESGLTVCLVRDDPDVEAAVRACCPPPHAVAAFSRQALVDEKNALSAEGEAIVRAAASADAVLVEWVVLEAAPAINALAFRVRRDLPGPVLMLCEGGWETQAACLAAGADDVLALPFHPPYLQAKVLAYRRLVQAARTAGAPPPDVRSGADAPEPRRFGDLRLDMVTHRFFIRGEEVALTPREFALLAFLIDHAGALCTRDRILDRVWGLNFDTGTNMVDVYMYFLRKKLEAHGLKGMIQTVRGHGYRLVLF